MDRAGIICITVSQVNQAAAENDDGTKTEAVGAGAAAEELNEFFGDRKLQLATRLAMEDLE